MNNDNSQALQGAIQAGAAAGPAALATAQAALIQATAADPPAALAAAQGVLVQAQGQAPVQAPQAPVTFGDNDGNDSE
jgi:hypothetical protein